MSILYDGDYFIKLILPAPGTQKNADYPCHNSILSTIFVRFKAFL